MSAFFVRRPPGGAVTLGPRYRKGEVVWSTGSSGYQPTPQACGGMQHSSEQPRHPRKSSSPSTTTRTSHHRCTVGVGGTSSLERTSPMNGNELVRIVRNHLRRAFNTPDSPRSSFFLELLRLLIFFMPAFIQRSPDNHRCGGVAGGCENEQVRNLSRPLPR